MNRMIETGKKRGQKGFTIPELLITVLVTLIIIAATTPLLLGTIQDYRLRGAAWQVAGDLRLVRQKSVSSGRPYRFTFNSNSAGSNQNSYTVERQEAGGNWTMDPAQRIYLQQPGSPTYVMIDPTSTPGGGILNFSANGAVPTAGTITLIDGRGKRYEVAINSVGRVNVTKF